MTFVLFIDLCNSAAVGIFGIVLSAAFCGIEWTRSRKRWMFCGVVGIYLLQGVAYIGVDPSFGRFLYPLHTHLPLTVLLCVLSGRRLWPVVSVLTAYLYCQLRRWLALAAVAILGGDITMQYAVELFVTLPLLLLLLKTAPAVRTVSRYSTAVQLQFGLIPAAYYLFDYITRVYSNLLSSGSAVVLEFMPIVCYGAYLIFVFHLSEEHRSRTQMEQRQSSLNLQIGQSMREIEMLRESQRTARAYRP